MKILLLNQFFWPDAAATSQLLTDVARALEAKGHDVTAISSGAGGYASTEAPVGAPNVRSFRVHGPRFGRGTLGRLCSYLSFYMSAAWRSITLPRQDLVLTLTTPPLLSLLGTLLKLTRGSRHMIWEMDMYPEVATDLEYFRRQGLTDRVVGFFADLSRGHADQVIALGECMRTRLLARGVRDEQISVVDNWADGESIQPLPRLGNPNELVLLYSGNLGLAHDLTTLLPALVALRGDDRFRFLFVGGGERRAELAETVQAHHLGRVHLLPYVERASLGESLALGDIGLVTQRDECCGSVVPSKVYGLLAAGRPILFIGPAAATPARIISRFGCGWHIPVGNSAQLHHLLLHLVSNPGEVRERGQAARLALETQFDVRHGVGRMLQVLEGADVTVCQPAKPQPDLHQRGEPHVCTR